MSDWSVEFYADVDGDSPVLDWYESLDEIALGKTNLDFSTARN
jgi:hypothetical protein